MLGRGVASALFVGATTAALSPSQALTLPAGTAVGDLAVFFVPYAGPGNIGAGWARITPANWPTFGYQNNIYYKTLDASDIASPPTLSSQGSSVVICHVYRGASTVTLKTSTEAVGGSSLSMTGYAKGPTHRGCVMFMADRDNPTTSNWSAPSGYVTRGATINNGSFGGTSADVLNNAYVGGNGVVGGSTTGTGRYGHMLELT